MEDKTTHEGIKGNKDKGATIKQVNTVCSIYRKVLAQSITKTMLLDKDADYMNFSKPMGDNIKGKFALNMWSTFLLRSLIITKPRMSLKSHRFCGFLPWWGL